MKRFFRTLFILLFTIVLIGGGMVGYFGFRQYEQLITQMPLPQAIAQIEASPDYTAYEQLPQTLVDATVAIEDRRFFYHNGVDYIGLARALFSQFIPGMLQSGGSTISQQTIKNMYGLFDSSLTRKVAEAILANQLETLCSKQEILALYVNIINYGNNYTGIEEASFGYFDCYPYQLDPAQSTILAGIPQSPTRYNLVTNFENAKERQKIVLEAMVENGYLSQEEADQIFSAAL